jgi:5'-nucleotidase
MHLLLTNDDGIAAPGLLALKQALEPLGKLTVVAPSRNYSAAGHRKTLHKPLRIDPARLDDGTEAWVCSGAPSDCVALALLGFVKEKVDLVVSGINPSLNLGQDLTYSGTVTAVLEAVIANVPGLAISTEAQQAADYAQAGRVAAVVAEAVLRRGLPAGVALNVNVPPGPLNGMRFTREGWSQFRDRLVERLDPRGRPYYWIGGDRPTGQADAGTDFWAMEQGYVSLTPLQLDLTAHAALPALQAWALDFTGSTGGAAS